MDRKENLKAYVWTAIASGFVGLLVGITAIVIQFYEPVMLRILLLSILAGVLIGTFSRGICLWMVGQKQMTFLWILVPVIIGIGTALATWCIGELPWGKVVILVAVAEILGMAIAYANYRQFIYVNEKLQQKREQFRTGS